MAPPRRKQIFYGTFISSKSRNELEFWHDTALYVDEEGKIVKKSKFQRHEFDNEPSVWTCMGWQRDEVDISIAKEGQFFFPGFIGETLLLIRPTYRLRANTAQTLTYMLRNIPTLASLGSQHFSRGWRPTPSL